MAACARELPRLQGIAISGIHSVGMISTLSASCAAHTQLDHSIKVHAKTDQAEANPTTEQY